MKKLATLAVAVCLEAREKHHQQQNFQLPVPACLGARGSQSPHSVSQQPQVVHLAARREVPLVKEKVSL